MTPELRAALEQAMIDNRSWSGLTLDAMAPIIDAAITEAIRTEAIQWADRPVDDRDNT